MTGLTNGTSYTFTVKATNPVGIRSGLGPIGASHSGHGARCTHRGHRHLQRQRPVGGVVDRSGLQWRGRHLQLHGDLVAGQLHLHTGTTSCTVTGLTNGTGYTFTVTATNSAGTGAASAPSATATPSTTPNAPTGVTATSNANAQSVVSWTAPFNGGATITKYTVTSSGGQTCTSTTPTPAATTCTVTGLTNGTSYTFTVTATNVDGTSAASAPSAPAVSGHCPGRTHRGHRHLQRQRPVGGVVDRSGLQRRSCHLRLHGDLVAGWLHLHHHRGHHLHGDRTDQR